MSQVDSSRYIDSLVPIWRRVSEIMVEKGNAFSHQAMANRIGYSRPTLTKMLNGSREIQDFELIRISKFLNVPMERITQEDVRNDARRLKELFEILDRPDEALMLAEKLESIAIGITEKCAALNNLGIALFYKHRYEECHIVWLEANRLAEQIEKKYGETDQLYHVLRNLVVSYTYRKDYSKAHEIIKIVEPTFESTPHRAASLSYTRAKIIESIGKLEDARRAAYESMDYCEETGNKNMIGRAQINVAHYEYRLGNYTKSKELLENSIENLFDDLPVKMIALKELTKTLLKLGDQALAVNLINTVLESEHISSFPDIEGKLILILSTQKCDVMYADKVVGSEKYSNVVRSLACKLLTKHYREINDAESFLKYHEIAESLSESVVSDFLDEEDL